MKKYIVPIVGFLMIIGIYFSFDYDKKERDLEVIQIEQKKAHDLAEEKRKKEEIQQKKLKQKEEAERACSQKYEQLDNELEKETGNLYGNDNVIRELEKNARKVISSGDCNQETIAGLNAFIDRCKDELQSRKIQRQANKIKEEQRRKEQAKEECISKYRRLEYRFQSAKGLLNDNEEEITSIKGEALKLLHSGKCGDMMINELRKLTNKCDSEL